MINIPGTRLVDPIVPGAVLTEAEEDGVDGHAVDTNEGVSYQVGEQDGHHHLGPEILHLLVLLEDVVGQHPGGDDHHQLTKEQDK